MSDDKTYNGWANYETWNVALWLDNEHLSYRYWREQSQECWDEAEAKAHWTREEEAAFTLADRLKAELEESMPDLGSSVWADLLGAALSEVNWREIAEHYIEDVEREAEEPAEAD